MTLSAQAKDIIDTAVAAGSFKTLATALGAAGLVDMDEVLSQLQKNVKELLK